MKKLIHRASAGFSMLRQKAGDLLENKSGATMIEYSVLIGLLTVAVVAIISLVGIWLVTQWSALRVAIGA